MTVIIFFITLWYVGLFFQTFFLHRHAAHGLFVMSKSTEKVFFVLTWLFQGSSYLSPYAYGIMHRLHHEHADTEDDPHSPLFSKGFFDMMWKTKVLYSQLANREVIPEPRLLKNLPDWPAFDKFANSGLSRIMWGAVYIAFFFFFATAWWQWALLPMALAMAPIHGAIINWCAHKYGYRNFECADTSVNFLPFDFLMMGESYHNNHHVRGLNPNFGYKWHEIDPTYQIIKVLLAMRIIKLNQPQAVIVEVGKPAPVFLVPDMA
jgi:stearoyl-CoA desaturase (Delta-9 desaturase)